jgi:radical SAM protein (TIGR01212 family)
MRWGNKSYHSLDYELKKVFGEKVIKLSLDGGFTCPNRDGTIGTKGCLFCSEKGSGEFAAPGTLPIAEQIEQQAQLLSTKWSSGKYIGYFQNFTNTYAPVEVLEEKYRKVLSNPGIVGLAIATRPDCLPDNVLNLLEKLNKETYLWIELGLQTVNEDTAKLIRRGYALDVFEAVLEKLKSRNINVVTHLILGLPYEDKQDILTSVRYVSKKNIWGVKFHLLHILKNSDLHEFYKNNNFHLLSQEEYINLIVDAIELIPPEMIVHRLTGDGAKKFLVAPLWSANKRLVLNGIEKEIKCRNTYQGKVF